MLLALVLAAAPLTPSTTAHYLLEQERRELILREPSREPALTFLFAGAGSGLAAVGSAIGFAWFAAAGPEDDEGAKNAFAAGMILGGLVAVTCIVLGIIEWRSVSDELEPLEHRVAEIDHELGTP